MYEIYAITNLVNGKKYVGTTKRGYMVRFRKHIQQSESGSTAKLHCAMRKYGIESFTIEVIESDIPDNQASQKEREYIAKFNTLYANGHGYNVDAGGRGNVGYTYTEADKQKMSNSMKGHKFPESRNLKIKAAMLGREYKQEWKDALSKARKGRFTKEDNHFYGKHHSTATKEMIGETKTKYRVQRLDAKTLEVLQVFKNRNAAGEWVVSQGLSSAKPATCAGRIYFVCCQGDLNNIAYTYKWRFEEKSID